MSIKLFAFGLLTVLVMGCTTNSAFRTLGEACDFEDKYSCRGSYITDSSKENYSLSFIEFDDQGLQHDRERTKEVLQFIRDKGENQDIIIFTHGWHHNAGYNDYDKASDTYIEDSNIQDFRKLLADISANNKGRKTTGVYIGWRGESVDVPLVNILSFWGRKKTSMNVGHGALKEVLVNIEAISKTNESNHLLTIGHSFGGSAVFSALGTEIQERILNGGKGKFGDMVILVNPAIENIPYAPLAFTTEDMAKDFVTPLPPSFIVLMNKADWANKYVFRTARYLSAGIFENQNAITRKNRNKQDVELSQLKMDTRPLGHYEPFISHKLESNGDHSVDSCFPATGSPGIEKSMPGASAEGWVKDYPRSNVRVTHLKRSPSYSPLWVVQVEDGIIEGHNGIFGDQLHCFMKEMIFQETIGS